MPELLRPWSRVWRYLLAAAVGVVAWAAMTAVVLAGPLTAAQQDVVGAVLVLDFALGAVTLALLPLRRRHLLVVACLTSAACAVSVTSMGPAALAVASMAARRQRIAIVAAMFLAGSIASEFVYRPRFLFTEGGAFEAVSGVVLGGVFFAAAVAAGYYVAARRELVDSLRERALTAEREQALAAKVARDAERNRIAREMHDVLAHRISMVALHAGALTYRDDLDRGQTAETAQTIQENARLALAELREVLGVLRADGSTGISADAPQPTLAQLPALLADAREAGSAVRLDSGELLARPFPETLSRTAFRIVQEALTNARKHAPGEPVVVRLTGAEGEVLEVEIRNPLAGRASAAPSSGVGLLGLAERAELAGGTFAHGPRPDGSFVVTARLPWQS
ncbi:sensor histidine kinase [Lentzea flaviverrucosa]|uniref:histidine kinase n=1 Tax=Lentzea flaviverrucosa TaxID=200379 RepID=A0A1H8ZVT1_9PSEU|nr:histidine kinase [Lentzea flaviverrucosa]RDI32235.1 signal transduction histidine kinase [Lentzea flaviverrucosa]SEP68552.1 Signal transduction histidine kinase [Lentzea flaviverrucosa]